MRHKPTISQYHVTETDLGVGERQFDHDPDEGCYRAWVCLEEPHAGPRGGKRPGVMLEISGPTWMSIRQGFRDAGMLPPAFSEVDVRDFSETS